MRSWLISVLALALCAGFAASASAQTSVTYRLYHFESGNWVEYSASDPFPAGGDQPGTNQWRYTYELCNNSFSTGVRELNVFFNSDNVLCATYQSATQPASWTATLVGPIAPNNNWRLRFRTLVTAARIAQGACDDTFSIDFLWECAFLPGSQNYDAISSSGSHASQTGPAAPTPTEPATWGSIKSLFD